MSEMTTLSISQLPRLAVEVLKPTRPRLLLPASSVPALSVAVGFKVDVMAKVPFRNTEKLFAAKVRYTASGPM